MLELTRRKKESFTLFDSHTKEKLGTITLIEIYKDGTRARIGIDCEKSINIVRNELLGSVRKQKCRKSQKNV